MGYPEVFACQTDPPRKDFGPPFSELHKTMIDVIGDCGYAYNHTSKKGCHGSYHYDDETSDPSCMVSEYTHTAMTTVLGWDCDPFCESEDHRPRIGPKGGCNNDAGEWDLCSSSRMMNKDPRGYAILTNASLKLPTVMPTHNGYQGKMPPFKFKPPNTDVPKTSTAAALRNKTVARGSDRHIALNSC